MSPNWGKATVGRTRSWPAKVGAVASAVALIWLMSGTGAFSPSATAAAAAAWPANVFAVGTFDGIPGNVTSTGAPTVATIQGAVDQAETWAKAHSCNGAPCDTFVLLAPGDYKTVATSIKPAPSGQTAAGVLIDTDNVWLVGMNRDRVIVDGTRSGPPCSTAATDQVLGPSTSPAGGLNGVMVWKAGGTWVENLTACNFLDGTNGAGNEIWWNGGANGGVVYNDTLGGYQGNYLTATSTFYPQENPQTGVSTDLAGESLAATYGIFSSDWNGGVWNQTYASNFNDSGYYIGACQNRCNQTVDHAWAEYNALGYSGSNSGGRLLVEHSRFDNNEDGFDTNSQNGDNPPPQDGACPAGVTPPVAGAHTCWVFYDNVLDSNNNPDVPTYGSAGAGPVGTGMSLSGARNDTILDNSFSNNGGWGAILVPYPDSGPPCTGGTPINTSAGSVCWYDEFGDGVIGNTFTHNGFFGNPSNGDIAATNLEPGPTDCFSANKDSAGLVTSPPEAETLYPACTGATVPPDSDPVFLDQVACDSGTISIVGPVSGNTTCPPNAAYPRQTRIVMHPLSGAVAGQYGGRPVPALENPASTTLPTMPNLCPSLVAGGMANNPWCPAETKAVLTQTTATQSTTTPASTGAHLTSTTGQLPATGASIEGLTALGVVAVLIGLELVLLSGLADEVAPPGGVARRYSLARRRPGGGLGGAT